MNCGIYGDVSALNTTKYRDLNDSGIEDVRPIKVGENNPSDNWIESCNFQSGNFIHSQMLFDIAYERPETKHETLIFRNWIPFTSLSDLSFDKGGNITIDLKREIKVSKDLKKFAFIYNLDGINKIGIVNCSDSTLHHAQKINKWIVAYWGNGTVGVYQVEGKICKFLQPINPVVDPNNAKFFVCFDNAKKSLTWSATNCSTILEFQNIVDFTNISVEEYSKSSSALVFGSHTIELIVSLMPIFKNDEYVQIKQDEYEKDKKIKIYVSNNDLDNDKNYKDFIITHSLDELFSEVRRESITSTEKKIKVLDYKKFVQIPLIIDITCLKVSNYWMFKHFVIIESQNLLEVFNVQSRRKVNSIPLLGKRLTYLCDGSILKLAYQGPAWHNQVILLDALENTISISNESAE